MRVVLDVSRWGNSYNGISIYIVNLLNNLQPLLKTDEKIYLGVRPNRLLKKRWNKTLYDKFHKCVLWPSPWCPGFGKFDLYHVTYPRAPYAKYRRVIITFHDLYSFMIETIFPNLPKNTEDFHLNERNKCYKAVKKADAIICVSENTKRDLIKFFPETEKISYVIPLGVNKLAAFDDNISHLNYIISKKYFLHIGSLGVIRNLPRTIEAFSRIKSDNVYLVLVGYDADDSPCILDTIRRLNLENRVIIIHKITEAEKVYLLKNAVGLLMFHLYAGFGLPLLEAMEGGLPIAASPRGAISEIAEGAALYAEPEDIDGMTEVMVRLLEDTDKVKNLLTNAQRRISFFSWEQTAKKTLDVYRQVSN